MTIKLDRTTSKAVANPTVESTTPVANAKRSTNNDGFVVGQSGASLGQSSATLLTLATSSAPLTAALDAGDKDVVALYGSQPLPALHAAIKARNYPREALVDLLREQNVARGAKQPVLDNIERLKSSETVTVVTGQQVGLLGGPLYSLFKALGAVNEAARLTAQGIDAVPVFWLASYDHDLAEVNHVGVLGDGQEPTKLELDNPGRRDLTQVGDEKLGDAVTAFLDGFEQELGDAAHKAETMAMLREIYTPDETYAGAFAKLFGQLTDDHGLVILDPNRRAFNTLAKPVLEKELFGAPTGPLVEAASQRLTDLGYEPQIDARSDRLNVFFVDDDGLRVALERVDGGFNTNGTPNFLSDADARALLDTAPERFSPSALLRPVVEDVVLPTIGYVGGPSERKYYAQVGSLYEWAGVPAPHSMKRPSFAVVSAEDAKTITTATGKSLPELLDDPQLMETLGRAGVPKAVRQAYAPFEEHRSQLQEIASTFDDRIRGGANRLIMDDLKTLRAGIALTIKKAKTVVRNAGLERLDKGLDGNQKNLNRLFDGLIENVKNADAAAGRTPSSSPFGGLSKALSGLDGQLVKVGRQERPDLVGIMSRLKPRGAPQEREMSIAQLVAEHGRGIVKTLLPEASVHQSSPQLVVQSKATAPAAKRTPPDSGVDPGRYDGFRRATTTNQKPVDTAPVSIDRIEAQRLRLDKSHAALVSANPEQTFRVQNPVNVSVLCLGGMGGSGNVARTCAKGLADAGHAVHVLSSDKGFFQDERTRAVTNHVVGVPKSPQEPDASWVKPLTRQIVNHVLKEKIEVVDVHYVAGLLEAAIAAKNELAARGYNLKVAATLHGSDVSIWGKNPKHTAAIRAQLLECDDVTCVSHHLAAQASDVFSLEVRPRVIENSIDEIRFNPAQWTNIRDRIAPHGERIFCHVSNMRAVKRPIDAIDTFAKVRKGGLNAKLLLIGDGPMLAEMHQRAVQHGIADDILCTGPQPPDKLAKYVAASDVVLVTSETESFCLAALEAMACGTPVVGTRCGGLEEIMADIEPNAQGISSLLSKVGDTDHLAQIALDLLSDGDRYEAIQDHCVTIPIDTYPQDRQVRSYLERIEDLRPSGLEIKTKPRARPKKSGATLLDVRVRTIGQQVASKKTE